MTEEINTGPDIPLSDSDLHDLKVMGDAFDGIVALRARHNQLLTQRNSGGKWGVEEDTELKRTGEYLGLIEDQQSRADKKAKPRRFGGNVISHMINVVKRRSQ